MMLEDERKYLSFHLWPGPPAQRGEAETSLGADLEDSEDLEDPRTLRTLSLEDLEDLGEGR